MQQPQTGRAESCNDTGLPLPFRSLADLVAEEPAELPWIWRGLLVPSAITIISGRPKVGKSSLVSALLPKLAGGETFLDLPTRPTRTLLLTEENAGTLVEKARLFGAPAIQVLCSGWVAERPWQEVAARAAQYACETEAGLLVIDTFNSFSRLRGEEENMAGAVLEAIAPLRAATTRGLAVLLVTHERKSGGTYGEGIRGSGALLGAVDIAISISRSKIGPNVRELDTVSRFLDTPSQLVIALDNGTYRALGADGNKAREAQEVAEIRITLSRLGEADIATLAEESGLPEWTVRRRVRKLENVESTGDGKRGSPERFRLRGSRSTAA